METTQSRRSTRGRASKQILPIYSKDDMAKADSSIDIHHASPRLVRQPQAPETMLVMRLASVITLEHVWDEWYGLIPTRIGHSTAVDLSTEAMIAANTYRRNLQAPACRSYHLALGKALSALRIDVADAKECHSDDTLIAVAELSAAQAVANMNRQDLVASCHFEGLRAILEAKVADGTSLSPIAQRVLEHYIFDAMMMACANGVASPFENTYRVLERSNGFIVKDANTRLTRITHVLIAHLPRLVMLVRALQEYRGDQGLVQTAVRLSTRLLWLLDEQAESEMLHSVSVVQNTHPADVKMAKYGFQFRSAAQAETLIYYWQTRIHLIRLCARLDSLSSQHDHSTPNFDIGDMEELRRLSTNLLMSASYSRMKRSLPTRRVYGVVMVALWGVLNDSPNLLRRSAAELVCIRAWLLSSASQTCQIELAWADMDDAADMMIGGPLKGAFVDHTPYKSKQHRSIAVK